MLSKIISIFRSKVHSNIQVIDEGKNYRIDVYDDNKARLGSEIFVLKTGRINLEIFRLVCEYNVPKDNIRCFDKNLKLITGGRY